MSVSCDGAISENGITPIDTEPFEKRDTVAREKNFPLENGFKGFEKVPRVLISRYNITPYLRTGKLGSKSQKSCTVGYLPRLSQHCLVKLCRDDLDKLTKIAISLNRVLTPKEVSSDSDSDLDDAEMTVKCKICDKLYSSEKKLNKHQSKKHMIVYGNKPQKRVSFSDHIIVHEVKEYHKCRKCTKIFDDYKSLKIHMKHRHKKRKSYICNYCNKNFIDRMFFKVHIKLHCDVCSLLLPNKSQYIEHRRNVCRVFKLHKCRTCNESFFKFMDLKDHSYEHFSTLYVCDICKDQFSTKCAAAHHISFLHSEKRPISLYMMRNLGTERLYLCNFCEESSVDKNLIEAHVQILPDLSNKVMTGYKDYYFCDQCFSKFATETDMLQHKWTHFLNTSDNSQIGPKSILSKKQPQIKTVYKVHENIPDYFKPNVVLEKLNIGGEIVTKSDEFVDVNVESLDATNSDINKPVVDPKSKKTIISKHQCQTCGKYYSSNFTLRRHIETQHSDYENLRCKVCEETFVWPSLLQSHKCVRLNIPEMPFQDARPEIHFDNLHEITQNGFDDLNITENDDYLNSVDFDIPAPVEESENRFVPNSGMNGHLQLDKNGVGPLQLGYKLVMQEVPIEF